MTNELLSNIYQGIATGAYGAFIFISFIFFSAIGFALLNILTKGFKK